MKVAGIAKGHAKDHLRALKQIGIDDLVYYDMAGMPLAFDELDAVRKSVEQFGLRVAVVEGGPPMDQIVAGGPGRDVQIEQYKVAIGNMDGMILPRRIIYGQKRQTNNVGIELTT